MSLFKISISVTPKFSPQGQLQQSRTTVVNFLKTRLFNLNVCKNHNGNISLYDSTNVQKYLNFIKNENSASAVVSSKTVMNICKLLECKKNAENELKSLEQISSEDYEELKELIDKDKEMLLNKIKDFKSKIIDSIVPVNEDDKRNVELQVVPNIGGEEAKLFSKEVFSMYFNYVNYKNWEYSGNPDNGYIYIKGDNIYGQLKYEMGIHRVQRVPDTENLGRTHTSTCTVLVLPQPIPGEVVFNEKEVIVDTMRSSGPGGQNVNKTESCVRVTHKPTGISVENQTSRFQYENKKIALERLRGIIFNMKQDELKKKINQLKKQHVATNIYSDKIRTYNFNQNRVTDHRLQFTVHNLRGFLSGAKELDRMILTVREYFKQEELKTYIQNVLQTENYKKFENKNSN